MKRKILIWSLAGLALIAAGLGMAARHIMKPLLSGTEKSLDPELRVFLGQGGNSFVLLSTDRKTALVVDTKMGKGAKRLQQYVADNAPGAEVIVVNTHYHSDHSQGNALFPKAHLIAGAYDRAFWEKNTHSRYPDEVIAPGEEKVLEIGTEQVHLMNMGQGHSRNDVVVYLESRRLLVTGDLVFNGLHPAMFKPAGSNIALWISALESLIGRFDPLQVVPGHGPMGDKQVLIRKLEYFTSIRDAADDPERLAQVRRKYKDFISLPGMSGFDKTLEFIRDQKDGK